MFAKLDQGGQLGFQLDVLRSVLVDSQSLDDMTQAQSLDQLEVHFATFLSFLVHESQQVEGCDVRDAGQNLVCRHCGCCHTGFYGGPNRSFS